MTTLWIDEGCIACAACVDVAPEIFALDAGDGCLVCGAARVDGLNTPNAVERSPLRPGVLEANAAAIEDALAGCPTECIKRR